MTRTMTLHVDDCNSYELEVVQLRRTPPYRVVQPGITVARPARLAGDTVAVPLSANLSSETRMAMRNRSAPRDVARGTGRGHERGGGPEVGCPLTPQHPLWTTTGLGTPLLATPFLASRCPPQRARGAKRPRRRGRSDAARSSHASA